MGHISYHKAIQDVADVTSGIDLWASLNLCVKASSVRHSPEDVSLPGENIAPVRNPCPEMHMWSGAQPHGRRKLWTMLHSGSKRERGMCRASIAAHLGYVPEAVGLSPGGESSG